MNPHLNNPTVHEQQRKIAEQRFRDALRHDMNSALWKSFEDVLTFKLDDLTISVSNGNASLDELRFIQGRMFEIIELLKLRSNLVTQ